MLLDFVLRRLFFAFIAMLGLLVLVFVMARLTGDPALLYLPETASAEMRQQFREVHGLNDPIHVQLYHYLLNSLQLDFGTSLRRNIPAMEAVMQAFPWTLRLAGITVVLAMIVAFLVGPLAAYRPSSVFDRIASVLSLAAASTPDFWLAIMAILFFSVQLGLLPTSGTGGVEYWILPIGVLMFKITGTTTQVVRGAMITSLASPYVKAARAKGMPEGRVIFVHALRNSVISAVTVAGDQTRGLINGAVIVETIFGWPGVGKLMIDAIVQRDFAVLQAAVIVTAASIFLLNIVIDIIYTLLDPRIKV
ncbi:ABC transporter permease [Vannielia litorea]|uniref:Peptide/nickel transport system permease protein n=1 Tax=Vannielia litorea TaxID=1217970 RepID=A0A1N6GV13_9RHOB|nr:ABC transporter permease [Vannielia litorea]SIO11368.1 peptide/nickel transport system permease protein [Vannielia litorea]